MISFALITTIFVLMVSYVFSRVRFKMRRPMMNVMLILGMSFFTIGSGISMQPLGEGIGISLSKSKPVFSFTSAFTISTRSLKLYDDT